ncbi:MAG: DUF167 domain-containing protein [Micavibrio sp.]|nr:MAG: DUF167 domain-containing protein [Micavibrio sp.]
MPLFFEKCDGGLRLYIRVSPKSRRNAIIGIAEDGNGGSVLKIAVSAVPENGKSNQAVIKLLSKTFGIAKSDIRIISGDTSRNKTLFLKTEADPDHILQACREAR